MGSPKKPNQPINHFYISQIGVKFNAAKHWRVGLATFLLLFVFAKKTPNRNASSALPC
jgi:hypothetical protein